MIKENEHTEVRRSRFPASLFGVYLGVLLLMSGVHTGLIVLMNEMALNKVAQCIVPLVYWGAVAIGLTLFTRKKIKDTYENRIFSFHTPITKTLEWDINIDELPRKAWLSGKEFHRDQFNKIKDELNELMGDMIG